MTRARSKAARRRARQIVKPKFRWKSVASLHGKFEREAEREFARSTPKDNPPETVIKARARIIGRKPSRAMLSPHLAEEAGRAIDIGSQDADERAALWTVFLGLDRAEHAWFGTIIGRPRFPAVSRMAFMPERFETRVDDRPDPRTEEERIRDTANRWMLWQGHLAHLRGRERTAIVRATWQMDELHRGACLTAAGRVFVHAMRMLRKVVDRSESGR